MSLTERKIAERPNQIFDRLAEFFKAGDLEGVVSMFHPDCKICLDPEKPFFEGHRGARDLFSEFTQNKVALTGTVFGEMINGDTALTHGEWRIEDKKGILLVEGISTEVVKQLDHGGWVILIDCPIQVPTPEL